MSKRYPLTARSDTSNTNLFRVRLLCPRAGPVVDALGAFTKLTELVLGGNQLTGTRPVDLVVLLVCGLAYIGTWKIKLPSRPYDVR